MVADPATQIGRVEVENVPGQILEVDATITFPADIEVTQGTIPWVVSGTVTADQGGTWTVAIDGSVEVTQGTTPWDVSQDAGSNPWVVDGTVVADQGGSWSVTADQGGTWTVAVSGTVAVTQSGSWTVTADQGGSWSVSVAGTVAVTQSGSWTVAATQSGSWTVSATVTGTVTANQGGSWTVAATQSGTWNVVVTGTVAATQSGSWTVAATQSGSWTVAVTGTVAVTQSGAWTVAATQSGSWTVAATVTGTVAATQSGTWTVAATQSGTWTIATTNASVGLTGATPPTSATLVGGTDGTDLRGLLTDSGGRQIVQQPNNVLLATTAESVTTAVTTVTTTAGVSGRCVVVTATWIGTAQMAANCSIRVRNATTGIICGWQSTTLLFNATNSAITLYFNLPVTNGDTIDIDFTAPTALTAAKLELTAVLSPLAIPSRLASASTGVTMTAGGTAVTAPANFRPLLRSLQGGGVTATVFVIVDAVINGATRQLAAGISPAGFEITYPEGLLCDPASAISVGAGGGGSLSADICYDIVAV